MAFSFSTPPGGTSVCHRLPLKELHGLDQCIESFRKFCLYSLVCFYSLSFYDNTTLFSFVVFCLYSFAMKAVVQWV